MDAALWIGLVALLIGVLLGYLGATARWKARLTGERALAQQRAESLEKERADWEARTGEARDALQAAEQARQAAEREGQEALRRQEAVAARLEEREQQVQELRREAETFKEGLEALRSEARSLQERLAREEEQRGATEKLMRQKEADFQDLAQRFQNDFQVLADRIFEAKDKAFREKSKADMDALLKPLQDKLGSFHEAVQASDRRRVAESSQLKEQIKHLSELNETMRAEANSLTNALKGDSKVQGDWGEVILERLLESSGLERDREYTVQTSQRTEDGRQLRPDVVLHLPDQKNLVIDAKVSLTAYERYASTKEGPARDLQAKAHLESLRQHVRGLSDKNYTQLYGIDGVDFVLLFIPIEPAFSLALRQQEDFFLEAFRRNVVLVTPSTLLATLRTIAQVWRQEKQHKNVARIAEEAGKLHDKFVGLLEDMERLGRQFGTAQKTYDGALKKLSTGTGNLVGRVDRLRVLGAKAQKQIPDAFKDAAAVDPEAEAADLELEQGEDSADAADAENGAARGSGASTGSPSGEGLFGP